jgi:hypothetical protein
VNGEAQLCVVGLAIAQFGARLGVRWAAGIAAGAEGKLAAVLAVITC